MTLHPHTRQRRKKIALILGLLIVPLGITAYLLFLYWKPNPQPKKAASLNTHLPLAHLSDKKEPNKMGLYQLLGRDSSHSEAWAWTSKTAEDRRDSPEPASKPPVATLSHTRSIAAIAKPTPVMPSTKTTAITDSANRLFDQRIRQLQALITAGSSSPVSPVSEQPASLNKKNSSSTPIDPEVPAFSSRSEHDPELDQLNDMLNKVLAIQHPETIAPHEKHQQPGKSLSMVKKPGYDQQGDADLFFNLSSSPPDSNQKTAIAATISRPQTLTSGGRVQLSLLEPVSVQGVSISAGTSVWGLGRLTQERLMIHIASITLDGNIYPVSMNVYDLDGLEGIQVPNSLTREAGKESANNTLSDIGMTGLDPSLGAQAATAGIQTAKSLIGKSVKAKRMTLPAGYRVILFNNN